MLSLLSSTPLDLHLPQMASKGTTEQAVARNYEVFSEVQYADFKSLFTRFRDLCDEFQTLSGLTAILMTRVQRRRYQDHRAAAEMKANYHALQVAMIAVMVETLLHLLLVWQARLAADERLPFGAHEILDETVRVIFTARMDLLRPRYIEALDDQALTDADQVDKLLKLLLKHSPKYRILTPVAANDDEIDRELMRLIRGG